jgi:hypothetical protein
VFEPTSRYVDLATDVLTAVDENGDARVVAYVRRRFVPATTSATLVSHALAQGERLDHLAARYLGDPTQFWRICDANGVLRPEDLVQDPGRRVDLPLPGGI